MKHTASPTTRVTPAKTATLASSTLRRRGTALRLSWMVPVEYSALTTSTARTPMASWASRTPARLARVGSNAWGIPPWRAKRDARAEVTMAPSPTPTTAVMRSVHTDERTERSLVHSAASTPPNP